MNAGTGSPTAPEQVHELREKMNSALTVIDQLNVTAENLLDRCRAVPEAKAEASIPDSGLHIDVMERLCRSADALGDKLGELCGYI